jgi:UDP-3-O-[3-hydroxymyristoyl] N-acetylglucosamine deacetylase
MVVIVEGVGLHTGLPVRVQCTQSDDDARLSVCGKTVRILDLVVVSTEWRTEVASMEHHFRVCTVEHAFAACAALGLHRGITLSMDGSEMPILDGGSSVWCDALGQLNIPPAWPRARVARSGIIDVGSSHYEFEPFEGVEVEVDLVSSDSRLSRHARWDGGETDFRQRIAPARTFAFERDIESILELGLARHVPRTSVVLIREHSIDFEGHSFESDEPARHKLLDLMGDMYLHGGPPLGRVRARRPGHRANMAALLRARAEGLLVEHPT